MIKEKISAILVFEMLGRPKEHITQTMQRLIESLEKEQGLKIIKKKFNEAVKFEQKDKQGKVIDSELYSTFSEVEMECEDMLYLLAIMFRYMPAHIEIITPNELKLTSVDLASFYNNILTRLHQYDAIAKSALLTNQSLSKQLQEMRENNKTKPADNSNNIEQTLEEKPKKDNKSKKSKS